ncbi:sal-like protein 1 [Glossina fuscipes]|uniref:Sal-like protein 1 n=1 Tax=Glossina fuscipes TaxID=7396 RepID=A0A8U0W841_9MUSC|nr:sal-like protein 1 [Glossina fuscipes]
MIFRIEHILPRTSDTSPSTSVTTIINSDTTTRDPNILVPIKSTKKVQRAGVHVAQFTPKNTTTQTFPSEVIMAVNTAQDTDAARAYCALAENSNTLNVTAEIMRKIKLSEDIHSYNALYEMAQKDQMHLRIIREIPRDEEIVAWFSEDIILMMSIPFLTPINIQGNNRYTCHLCHLTFETPNPLKIHLALNCGRHNIDILWLRLHYAIKAEQYMNLQTPQQQQQLFAERSISTSIANLTSTSLVPQVSRFSAFKPISSLSTSSNITIPVSASDETIATTTNSSNISFIPTMSNAGLSHVHLLQPSSTSALNAAAQIEAIVSNMGASKQGHLCIYCGKVYSRKYGLKIHIRTHTGFKPLKCKFCLRPFGDPSNLNKHVRLHLQSSVSSTATSPLNESLYHCHLCNKTVARRRDLQRHLETRHGSNSNTNHNGTNDTASST